MTENKRFNVFDIDGTIFLEDHKEGSYHIGEIENVDVNCLNNIADRLNELAEENKELKAKVDDKEVAVEVECGKLMQKVFDLIDKSLEKDKRDYEMSYEDYLNGRIEALEDLKKELQK